VDLDLNSANLLTLARLGLVPCCLIAAYAQRGWWFAGFSILSEIFNQIYALLAHKIKPAVFGYDIKAKEIIELKPAGTIWGARLDYFADFASYIFIPIAGFILWRGWMNSYENATPVRITFWTTTGERPRLETAFQGRDKARVLERCGEPDEETADSLYYHHLIFREPNERATTRPVRFLLSGDNVIHIEVGEENPN